MTNPVTHLLWGYVVSKNLSEEKRFILFGMFMSIILDLDAIIPGMIHHGYIHTPFFALMLCAVVYLVSRSRILSVMSFSSLFVHLVLDTIGTRHPIMWFYPLSESNFALGVHVSLLTFAVIKVILFSVPTAYVLHCYYKKGENPMDLYDYMKDKLGDRLTYLIIITFVFLIIYFGITKYLMEIPII